VNWPDLIVSLMKSESSLVAEITGIDRKISRLHSARCERVISLRTIRARLATATGAAPVSQEHREALR